MFSRGVLVHRLCGLGAAVAIQTAELLRGDRISAKRALEQAVALHHCDGVMPHSFKYSRLFQYEFRTKVTPIIRHERIARLRSMHRESSGRSKASTRPDS